MQLKGVKKKKEVEFGVWLADKRLVHFSSTQTYEQSNRTINRKGRLYKLEKVGKLRWYFVAPYDRKNVLLQGVLLNAIFLDIESFLFACEYDASFIQVFLSHKLVTTSNKA
ncbi:hypothetical protein TorRG33x02_178960 [Trema orientale]|uniref:Uncharacterized protein n=1 Tax=Trema orientale TaxID=63057 RepID=A0A2P5ELB3_TREOI|nr:hypothetical protein TorRG33x02_178960 [Trema orientale]